MAELSTADRAAVAAAWMREFIGSTGLSKAELRAALNAIDTWLETNKANLNTALPAAARTGLTTEQKAQLLVLVVKQRYLMGN